jgi:lycopene beta-cyclase
MYVLPLSRTRLFVEHVNHSPGGHVPRITAYLKDVLGLRRWERTNVERGGTPLYQGRQRRRRGRLVRIGVGGGLAKTTTGYALTRMWRDAEEIAGDLAAGRVPASQTRPSPLCRLGDRVFLGLVDKDPEQLRDFVLRLCASASGDAVLGFLDDRPTLSDQLEIARAAPGSLRSWLAQARRGATADPALTSTHG